MDKILSITPKMVNTIVDIESTVYGKLGWVHDKIKKYLTEKYVVSRFIGDESDIKAYYIYEDTEDNLRVLNMTVNPKFDSAKYFAQIIQLLKGSASESHKCVRINVREPNVELQIYLKQMGFIGKLVKGLFGENVPGITFTFNCKENLDG